MRAVVVERPGPPEVLELVERPLPAIRPGWALVQVKAFGLNRSEMFTRQGHPPGVEFPRVLGIECVGVVADPGDSGIPADTTVAALMGGMGRAYDGGYAEYALLPAERLMRLDTELDWATLGALPETFLTAAGSLETLALRAGQRLLPSGVKLTTFGSSTIVPAEGCRGLQRIADDVAAGCFDANVDRVFTLDEIVDAHRYMEANHATGKLVVTT